MPRTTDDQLRELRQRYNAAYTAHQSCMRALSEAALTGERPSQTLLDNEAKTLPELTDARAKFLAGMVRASGRRES